MTANIIGKIQSEIQQIESDVAAQKKLIRRSIGNQIVVESAESELTALRARRTLLHLQKYQNSQPV